jgi:hypothetical protein
MQACNGFDQRSAPGIGAKLAIPTVFPAQPATSPLSVTSAPPSGISPFDVSAAGAASSAAAVSSVTGAALSTVTSSLELSESLPHAAKNDTAAIERAITFIGDFLIGPPQNLMYLICRLQDQIPLCI